MGGPGEEHIDEDRQKAALDALEKGQVTKDAVAFIREQGDREWEIAKDLSQPDPMGFLSERDRQRDIETAYREEERYRTLADRLEKLA